MNDVSFLYFKQKTRDLLLWCLLESDGGFLAHGGNHSDNNLAALTKGGLDLLAHLTLGKLDIVLGGSVRKQEGHEPVVDINQGELVAGDVGDVDVVGGGTHFFKLLAREDVDTDEVDLGVAVLSSLAGAHFNDTTWTIADDDMSTLA